LFLTTQTQTKREKKRIKNASRCEKSEQNYQMKERQIGKKRRKKTLALKGCLKQILN
jgi:hypothetical protein